ncbi:MAG: hypothetical protein Ct9H90mP25_1950 [Gammaproteobacteria bacterium]|nr:MAG: hypothetical protein Ct9H90mP25_1950 [Gammaproteobacteria bacterium]
MVGDSRGYWDGDTLVIETKNFSDMVQSFLASPYGKLAKNRLQSVLLGSMRQR